MPLNATEIVKRVENELGVDLSSAAESRGQPLWKLRSMEAGRLNAAIKRSKGRLSLDLLALAVDYCRDRQVELRTPYGLLFQVEDAVAWREEQRRVGHLEDRTPLRQQVDEAVAIERGRPDGETWIGRLVRANGRAREEVLAEWRRERG